MRSGSDNIHLETLNDGSNDEEVEPVLSVEKLINKGRYNNPFDDNGRTRVRRRSLEYIISDLPSHNTVAILTSDEMVRKYKTLKRRGVESRQQPVDQVDQIVSELESDPLLMEDNPLSEQLRMETLREMPETLTLKRTIRQRLVKTVSQKSSRRPLSLCKRLKYSISISYSKVQVAVKTMLYSLELWYGSLKVIEGHFGSSVATYFRFLRSLFILNFIVFILSFGFIVVPQMLLRFYEPHSSGVASDNSTAEGNVSGSYEQLNFTSIPDALSTTVSLEEQLLKLRANPYAVNSEFSVDNIFTGEGFLTNTTLFYGYYTNKEIQLIRSASYNMPSAYFFTMVICYFLIFISLSYSMATSYRKSFIETAGGLKNVFAHKVFCGWDFSIATEQAASLKCKNILIELKELLSDQAYVKREVSCLSRFSTLCIRFSLHGLSLVLLAGAGSLVWYLLTSSKQQGLQHDQTDTSSSMVMSLVVTLLMMLGPMFFSWIVRYEEYRSPRTDLFITLLRTFLLEVVIVGILVLFWLRHASEKAYCWETSLGQVVYRLILVDFFIATIGTSLAEFARARIHRFLCKSIGAPQFDIARNTLNLVYNQILFFVGFYFSPLLSGIIVIKMFIMFYVRKMGALGSCVPSHRTWRAAQTHTLFLCLAFLSLLGVFVLYGYIITSVQTSSRCGPFRDFSFMYEMILTEVLNLQKGSMFWNIIFYLLKPGVVALLLIALSVVTYYMKAKASAHSQMVTILQEMLRTEAKDKDFLLTCISQSKWFSKVEDGDDDDEDSTSSHRFALREDSHVVSENTPRHSASTHMKSGDWIPASVRSNMSHRSSSASIQATSRFPDSPRKTSGSSLQSSVKSVHSNVKRNRS